MMDLTNILVNYYSPKIKFMKKLLQSLFLLLFIANIAMAQDRTLTGKVTGDDGQPIPGATVRLKGATGAVQTDPNGTFRINAAASATAVEVSSLGFTTKTVSISGNTINVVLLEDSKALSEVVVVAYGTAKREAITGSAASLGAKDIEKRTVTNISNALSGIAPGVSVGGGNGQPGTGSNIRLRGFGSFAASSSPLYVLDGAQFDGNLGDRIIVKKEDFYNVMGLPIEKIQKKYKLFICRRFFKCR